MTALTAAGEMADRLGVGTDVVDAEAYAHAVERMRDQRVVLPTFAELANPSTIAAPIRSRLASVDRDAPDPLNLFRVHWHNTAAGRSPGFVDVPEHVVLPTSLTGVEAPIVVLFGDRFPMITAHKVLAAYACLVPRLVTGRFDPTRHRAIWPSTGNYARGGVAISRILACRGVAVLPAGMSQERFDWLDRWVVDPTDVIRTPGSESNVKEIYDACNELERDPGNVILNQFCEIGNHLVHEMVTGAAFDRVFATVERSHPGLQLSAFVSATGSAGTIAAGDHLKDRHGTKVVAVEALECPTMLENGFGEHNIQGIGDKHIPLIHNVMNTDVVVAISDQATDELDVVFNTDAGRALLAARGVPPEIVAQLHHFGFSAIANVLAAIKVAKHLGLGPDQAVMTVATDGAALYPSERVKTLDRRFGGELDAIDAAATVARHLDAASTDHLLELGERDRNRIFNLGYFTWVEQQGLSLEVFESRRRQDLWRSLRSLMAEWDDQIREMNARTGVTIE